jgi:lipopolysaccharide transport system permease protein
MAGALLRGVWAYRGFVLGSIRRDFETRYRNSVLGAAWMVLNPLAMILVYTVIFSQVMRGRLPGVDGGFAYSIYLCAGLLTWGLFAEQVSRGTTVFVEQANLLKKLSFPRACLPVIVTGTALVNFSIVALLFLGFLLMVGRWPGWVALAALPVLAIQVCLGLGLGLVLGVFHVFFRDVGQAMGIVLSFWFWLTPIVYPASILPEAVLRALRFNPFWPLAQAYQGLFVHGTVPPWSALLAPALLALGLCILGVWLFRRHSADMVDEL